MRLPLANWKLNYSTTAGLAWFIVKLKYFNESYCSKNIFGNIILLGLIKEWQLKVLQFEEHFFKGLSLSYLSLPTQKLAFQTNHEHNANKWWQNPDRDSALAQDTRRHKLNQIPLEDRREDKDPGSRGDSSATHTHRETTNTGFVTVTGHLI